MEVKAEHIQVFSEVLLRKGYDAFFSTNRGDYGKLPKVLEDTFNKNVDEQSFGPLFPLGLFTYIRWDPNGEIISCFMTVDYKDDKGFNVCGLGIQYKEGAESVGCLRRKDFVFIAGEQIPNVSEAREIVNPQRPKKPKQYYHKKRGVRH